MRYRYLILLFFTTILSYSFAQNRGFKEININIDGQTTPLYKQSHALVIGVSDYTNGWPDLPGVKNDVVEVKKALETNGFNVVLVENVDDTELEDAIEDFINIYGTEYENRLLFYFAGHGHTIKTSYGENLGYIVPSNAPNPNYSIADFQQNAMEMARIEIYAKRIQSKHVLFIFDACFSGQLFALSRAIPEVIGYKTSRPVRQFITSGSADETVPDHSIFRQQFVSALSGEADLNNDNYITGSELGDFLQTSVINYSRDSQHPQYGKIRNPNLDKGDFVFILEPFPQYNTDAKIIITEEKIKQIEKEETLSEDKNYSNTVSSAASGILIDVRDSKKYKWVKIGKQIWMAENLKLDNANSTGYYRWKKALKACPNGWHLPSENEWTELIVYLGGEDVAGSKLLGTNSESKFNGIPGGVRYAEGKIGRYKDTYWWSSTKKNGIFAWAWVIYKNNGKAIKHSTRKAFGIPVRCLKN